MQIILNEQTYQPRDAGNQTVQQLADEVCGPGTGLDSQIIVSLKCDGQAVDKDRLQEVLDSPVDQFANVDMQTVSVREQVVSTLSQAVDVLSRSSRIRETIADSLSQGRHDAAMTEMRNLLEVFRQVQQTTILACSLIGTEPADIRVDDLSFDDILTNVRQALTELKSGMENQDFVLVSDLLRYEFAQPLEDWVKVLEHLQTSATTAAT